jgi:hypothetical protein
MENATRRTDMRPSVQASHCIAASPSVFVASDPPVPLHVGSDLLLDAALFFASGGEGNIGQH